MQRIQIEFEGLLAAHCIGTITSSLKRSVGVEEVSVDAFNGIATIVFDPRKVTPHDICDSVKSNGYEISKVSKPKEISGT